MIACILLSAGESRRFGSPKALADISGKKAIERIQETLLASSMEVIVVLGAEMERVKPYVFNHKKVRIVYNKDYKFGQTSSFQAGVNAVDKQASAIMLWPVDYPFISLPTIETLIGFFKQNRPAILIPTFRDRRGHPPVFNISLKTDILNLPSNQGAHTLFDRFAPMTMEVNDEGILKTFNTPDELHQLGA